MRRTNGGDGNLSIVPAATCDACHERNQRLGQLDGARQEDCRSTTLDRGIWRCTIYTRRLQRCRDYTKGGSECRDERRRPQEV